MRIGGLPAADEQGCEVTNLGGPCRPAVWVRQLRAGSCRSGSEEFGWAGARGGVSTAIPWLCLILPEQVCHGAMCGAERKCEARLASNRREFAITRLRRRTSTAVDLSVDESRQHFYPPDRAQDQTVCEAKRPLGCVGLGSLEGSVVGFAWGGSRPSPDPYPARDGRSIGLNGECALGDGNGKEYTTVPRFSTQRKSRVSPPGIEAEDPVGFRITYQPSIMKVRVHSLRASILRLLRPRRNASLFAVKPITLSSRSTRFGLERPTPFLSAPPLRWLSSPCRFRRDAWLPIDAWYRGFIEHEEGGHAGRIGTVKSGAVIFFRSSSTITSLAIAGVWRHNPAGARAGPASRRCGP